MYFQWRALNISLESRTFLSTLLETWECAELPIHPKNNKELFGDTFFGGSLSSFWTRTSLSMLE